jgi:hypothetical protein
MSQDNIQARSIELYFTELGISDPDLKARILPEVSPLVHDRNVLVHKYEAEQGPENIVEDIHALDHHIRTILKSAQ